MRKVLLLAYQFPPIVASGSMRPAGFCSYLSSYGYSVHVISADPESRHSPGRVDPSLMELLDPAIRIDRVDHLNWQQILLDLRRKFRSRHPAMSGAGARQQGAAVNDRMPAARDSGVLARINDSILNRLLLLPDEQKSWRRAVRRFARSLPSSERPDVVLATGNPWTTLLAGADISAEWDCAFVSDFRDPWTQNPKPALSPGMASAARRLERSVLHRSSRIIANTDALNESFQALYPEIANRLVTITNGYHERILAALEAVPSDSLSSSLDYFGAVYELRRPTALLMALKAMADEGAVKLPKPAIRFVGQWSVSDPVCSALADELEGLGLIERASPVPHGEYLRQLAGSRYLLILQQDFPLQIPAKIYEYIASGRPILVIGGAGATARLVRDHSLGMVVADDEASIKQRLTDILGEGAPRDAVDEATRQSFGYRALTRRLAEVLDEAIAAHAADGTGEPSVRRLL